MSLSELTSRSMTRRSFLVGTTLLGTASALLACSTDDSGTDASGDSNGSGDEKPSRVVALSTGHLDHCLAMGILPVGLAVAVSEATDSEGVPQYIQDVFADEFDLDSIEIVGERMDPDMESIAALKPDLILSNKRNPDELNDQLESIAPVVQTNGGSENFKVDLGIVGDALGLRDKADDLLKEYEDRAKAWGEERGNDDTISLVRAKGDQYLYFGTLALASIVAEDAGLSRPDNMQFDDNASRSLSTENAGDLDADWLFYSFPGGTTEIMDSNAWKRLPAVEADHAFEVDVDPWFINASVIAANRVLDDMQKFMG
jgi:iron complex transport system substrate-binding protein